MWQHSPLVMQDSSAHKAANASAGAADLSCVLLAISTSVGVEKLAQLQNSIEVLIVSVSIVRYLEPVFETAMWARHQYELTRQSLAQHATCDMSDVVASLTVATFCIEDCHAACGERGVT
jgi:hypothetical protein